MASLPTLATMGSTVASMAEPLLHPDLAELAILIGTWRGNGHGVYPTIESFDYVEEVTIGHIGKPFLSYAQRTRRAGDHPEAGEPLHAESGYWRPAGPGGVELVIAQPSGIVEVEEGTIEGSIIHLNGTTVATTTTAKEVRSVERRIEVEGDTLTYELWLGAVGQEHQLHLTATLLRE